MAKPEDFVKYKFKELKVYASTEWMANSQKKYRKVFDRGETTYIYAEFSFYNKLFDEEDWKANINLKAYAIEDGKRRELCSIPVEKEIGKDLNIVYIREGWGNDKPGTFWKEGDYVWEAYMDEKFIGSSSFYVYDVGEVAEDENPYFDIQSVKLYEGPNKHIPEEERTYYNEFNGKDARYIWVEFKAKNKANRDWKCEMVFNFYNDARQLKGKTTEVKTISKSNTDFLITSGWGSDYRGTWYADNYTLEIVFMDTLIAVSPFKVGEDYTEGDVPLMKPDASNIFGGVPLTPQEEEQELSLEELLGSLDELIGLQDIKNRIREFAQYLNFLKLRKERGFDDVQGINLHSVFKGNPGTGKTTVARMLGKIYHKLGLLSKGHVHEVDRSDIIAEYIGQTAPKVKEAIKKARGGILFIDEAYSLWRSEEDTKDYGREVIEILVKEMSDGKGDLAVIVAGYPKEMDGFLESNPGLRSRFSMYFNFPDYTPQELAEIAELAANKKKVMVKDEAHTYLYKKLVEAYRSRDRAFGNARYVFSLINEAKMNMGLRLMKEEKLDELTEEELSTIVQADFEGIFDDKKRLTPDIPVDYELLHEALGELDQMIGLQSVKNEVHELVKLVKFYREVGKDVLNRFSLHTVFVGNPGTGKTTVARILGRIYKALGILERGKVIECDRQGLVAGFTGQTAIKTANVIEQARGGVLFIDEAYALSQGGATDFGQEAIETILKRMEDLRGELIVIVAGYPDNMRAFLETNPGLKSRFDRKLTFSDYSPKELTQIAILMFQNEGITPAPDAQAHLNDYFAYLYRKRNKFFGNARAVRKVVEAAVKNQHLRLASMKASERNIEMLGTLTLNDVKEFNADNDQLLEGGTQGNIGF